MITLLSIYTLMLRILKREPQDNLEKPVNWRPIGRLVKIVAAVHFYLKLGRREFI